MTDRMSRLADVLLEEKFSDRAHWSSDTAILEKAGSLKRRHRLSRLAYSAAAACVAAAIVFLAIPPAHIHEEITTPGPGHQQTAPQQDNIIKIGTHVTITVSENARTRIPEDQANTLFVESGTVLCSVDPGGEGFKVLSEAGEAEVTGTVFTVTVENKPDQDPDITNVFMDVSVQRGTVVVRDDISEKQVHAGEKTRIQARIQNRKRVRQQKGKQRQNGRQPNTQTLSELQQKPDSSGKPDPSPGKPAPSQEKPAVSAEHGQLPAETGAAEAVLFQKIENTITKQAELTKADTVSISRSVVSALQENREAEQFPEIYREISDYSKKTGISREKVKETMLNHLQEIITAHEAETIQKNRLDTPNKTAPRHNHLPRTRNRHSRK